jgi:hypothetical protein
MACHSKINISVTIKMSHVLHTNISQEHTTSTFWVKEYAEQGKKYGYR